MIKIKKGTNNEYNSAFKDTKVKKAFFMKMALLKVLKNGSGTIQDGYVIPVKGKLPEFRNTIGDTLRAVGLYTEETEKELQRITF